jgi:phosphoenolpyruvate carboxylase
VDILRRVASFGLTLLRLDIRQESARHTEVMAEITSYLGIAQDKGGYPQWGEEEKQEFLLRELQNRRPLIPRDFPASADAREVLDTFEVLARQPAEALGAYIISMATHPSDVLAVRLLQKEAGGRDPQRAPNCCWATPAIARFSRPACPGAWATSAKTWPALASITTRSSPNAR